MSRRELYIDGTDGDGFTLSGSGRSAPFYLFDAGRQDWTAGPYRLRWVAALHLLAQRIRERWSA